MDSPHQMMDDLVGLGSIMVKNPYYRCLGIFGNQHSPIWILCWASFNPKKWERIKIWKDRITGNKELDSSIESCDFGKLDEWSRNQNSTSHFRAGRRWRMEILERWTITGWF